jgi:hypothetical protein
VLNFLFGYQSDQGLALAIPMLILGVVYYAAIGYVIGIAIHRLLFGAIKKERPSIE